jgi:3',5'-nucleoside bisphosphate phosphatase
VGGYGRNSADEERRRRDAALRRAARGEPETKSTSGPGPGASSGGRSAAGGGAGSSGTGTGASTRGRSSRYGDMQGDPVVPPYPSRVDLHTHSTRSDGILSPRELVEQAAAAGVRVLALADHDTLDGVRDLLAEGQPPLPLALLPGVEINSVATGVPHLWEGELHILGLGVDPSDDYFESVMETQRQHRTVRFDRIVDRLGMMGYPIHDQAAALVATHKSEKGVSLGRPQVARCLIEAGFVPSVDDAMTRLLGRGKPAYVPREGIGPMQAISAIRAGGGLPVLAHFADAPNRRDLVEELIGYGLGGLEVHYRHFDAQTIADMEAVARDLGLIPTGGSDYHGDGQTYAEAHATLFVPDEDAMTLYSALGRRNLSITGA